MGFLKNYLIQVGLPPEQQNLTDDTNPKDLIVPAGPPKKQQIRKRSNKNNIKEN